ncbi:hypothetical protein [Aeromonas dhakensis]|uniref:hypothetical protein n=1 Tax=Aeromonas dhakensis TaxID=196024 RepID=UPI0035716849
MNINAMNKLVFGHCMVNDYEFNRFDKSSLNGSVSVIKMYVSGESYSKWEGAAPVIFNSIEEKYLSKNIDIYCFIVSPFWKLDSRIVRYNGLSRAINKGVDGKPLDFILERAITSNNYVIFYGVVRLTRENAKFIFNLISESESGILFSKETAHDSDFILLIDELSSLVSRETKTSTFNLNVVDAIKIILSRGSEALFPYAWEETGDYHLDVFNKN